MMTVMRCKQLLNLAGRFVSIVSIALAWLAFAPTAHGQTVGFDVNDVSILLGAQFDRSDATASLNLGTPVGPDRLVPANLWQQYVELLTASSVTVYDIGIDGTPLSPATVPGPGLSPNALLAARQLANPNPTRFRLTDANVWALVAVRFDPCSPQSRVLGQVCVPQLRLVMQPAPEVSPSDRSSPDTVADQSIHLIYDLDLPGPENDSVSVQRALAEEVLQLKFDAESVGPVTNGIPLGVHPAIGTNAVAYRRLVENTVLGIIGGGRFDATLKEIAFHGEAPNPQRGRWFFFTARVVDRALFPVGLFFQGRPSAFERRGTNLVFSPTTPVFPQFTDGRPQVVDFFNPSFYETSSDRLAATFTLFNNPTRTAGLLGDQDNPRSITCLACHSSTNTLRRVASNKTGFLSQWANDPGAFIPEDFAPNVTGIIQEDALAFGNLQNFRNFGFFSTRATVALRTLNESVQSVQQLNALLNRVANGKRCDTRTFNLCVADRTASYNECEARHCTN